MNSLILECVEAIEEDMDDGYLVDEDSRLTMKKSASCTSL